MPALQFYNYMIWLCKKGTVQLQESANKHYHGHVEQYIAASSYKSSGDICNS